MLISFFIALFFQTYQTYAQNLQYPLCLNEFTALSQKSFNLDHFQTAHDARIQKLGHSRCDFMVFKIRDKKIAKLSNHHPDFVGIAGMRAAQLSKSGSGYGNLTKFRQWAKNRQWNEFSSMNHFDWWMFPISDQSSFLYGYSVLGKDVKALRSDKKYMRNYREGVKLMLLSWGWDIEKSQLIENPDTDQHWRHYDVRLRKLVQSLILFRQKRYLKNSLVFVKKLVESSQLDASSDVLLLLELNEIKL